MDAAGGRQARTRLCRNVFIHGFCKFEGRGCHFAHDKAALAVASAVAAVAQAGPSGAAATSHHQYNPPAFTPGSAAVRITAPSSAAPATSPDAAETTTVDSAPAVGPVGSVAAPEFRPAAIRPDAPAFVPSPQRSMGAAVASNHSILSSQAQQVASSSNTVAVNLPPSAIVESHHDFTPGDHQIAYHGDYADYYDEYPEEEYNTNLEPEHPDTYGNVHALTTGVAAMGFDGVTDPYYQGHHQQQHQQPHQSQKDQLDEYFLMQQQLGRHANLAPHEPLQYHLYNPTRSQNSKLPAGFKATHDFFINDQLRELLQKQNHAIQQVLDPNSEEGQKMPAEVHIYHSLYPLDDSRAPFKVFGFPTTVYKATSHLDSRPYVLRRIEGYRLTNEAAMSCVESWRQLRHTNLVSLHEAFTTRSFGDKSLIFVYDYHPLAKTMSATYFSRHDLQARGLDESVLWSYVCQLASVISLAHSHNLALRVIEPSKILITGKNRIRVNCCGIHDLLLFDSNTNIQQLMQEDLLNFAKLILALATGSLAAIQNISKCFDHLARNYSPDLHRIVVYLLSGPERPATIDGILGLLAPRLMTEVNSTFLQNDFLENTLSRELENARLVRLVTKLGFINERPEFDNDPQWSETGDAYLLKLFRDYVFHQVDETGAPILDMAHVLQCLNKLDAGVAEKIMLMSRDEKSCLIVSYTELKSCVDTLFRQLAQRRGRLL